MTLEKKNLMAASRQWAERPADERFWTLEELHERTKQYAEESKLKTLPLSECTVTPHNGEDLALVGPDRKGHATFQHYSFGQFANICGAPASYLRGLPARLAADNLNHGLSNVQGKQTLMFHQNGGLQLRCVTSDTYKRVWNYEIAELALALKEQDHWVTPPARPCSLPDVPVRIATQADVLKYSSHPGLGVKVGDQISPAGLYASDHDCFIFQVNEDISIDGGNGESMYRGVFWSNSEVGSAKFKATMFLYDTICGNHIVWGAKVLAEVSLRHTGEIRALFAEAMATITAKTYQTAEGDEQRIRAAKRFELGPSKEKIVELVFGKSLGLSKKEAEDAYVLAERHEDDHGNNPRSAWGYAAGITRLSQQQYADKRDMMDRAAGKVLEMAF